MSERALYVYGVVPTASPPDLFDDVSGIDPSGPVVLIPDGELSAVASSVPLDEFGEAAIEQNLRDPVWLADKARAHDLVLSTAIRRTTVVPFRFGAIYRSEDQVRDLLRERTDFSATLRRLAGATELGVKAFVDPVVLRERLGAANDRADDAVSAGRAYLQRKQAERRLDEDVSRFAAECAHEVHERLSTISRESRINPLQQPQDASRAPQMILNGAYLVGVEDQEAFGDALREVERTCADHGVHHELSGPWPPYNFVTDEGAS